MLELDQSLKGSERHVKGKLLTFLVASIFIFSLIAAVLITPTHSEGNPPTSNVPARISYTTHSPIKIYGNSGFNASNGVLSGNGTADNPYIIEGWDINASTDEGIHIENTNAYFIVRDCFVHDGGPTYRNGIFLAACENGVLTGNNCSNDENGIFLVQSSNNTLIANNCSNSQMNGIVIFVLGYNTISNNTCSWNNWYGIVIQQSSANTISNNTCSFSNRGGIYVESSGNNDVSNNSCSNIWESGIYLQSSNNNTLINNNCSSNNHNGIYLNSSSDNPLINNTCSCNVKDGICLHSSNSNIILRNWACNNTNYGTNITSGYNNRICDNVFIGNNGASALYDPSHIQARDDGTSDLWNRSGSLHGWGNYWHDWTLPDANSDGIVDQPYNISGGANAKDLYPLTSTSRIGILDNFTPYTDMSMAGTIGKDGWYISNVTVFLNTTRDPNGSGLILTKYSLDGSAWQYCDGELNIAAEGTHLIGYYSIDLVGNAEIAHFAQMKMDRTPPWTQASKFSTGVTLTAWDGVSGVNCTRYSIDGGAWHNYSIPLMVTASGNHSLKYYSIDNAGNAENIKVIYIDNGLELMTYALIIVVIVVAIAIISLFVRKKRVQQPPIQPSEQPPINPN
jgi:parallel beta-helix repeat protein